ncbi:MAG: lysophospholipid acyltransferase family protein, partial [Chitinophagales bacterium]
DEILFKFLGKQEADRLPFFSTIIHAFCVLVDRSDKTSRKNSYVKMKREMNKGFSVFLYIEGTRNRTTAPVKDFYDGAFRLAIEMQKPIVVNTLVGIRQINPPTSFFTISPGIITSHWDIPISTVGMTLGDIPALKEQVKQMMIKRLEDC